MPQPGIGLVAPGLRRFQLRLRGIERRCTQKAASLQISRAFKAGLRVEQLSLCLRQLRLAALHTGLGLPVVYGGQQLPAFDPVASTHQQAQHPAIGLRGHGALAHRLDHAIELKAGCHRRQLQRSHGHLQRRLSPSAGQCDQRREQPQGANRARPSTELLCRHGTTFYTADSICGIPHGVL